MTTTSSRPPSSSTDRLAIAALVVVTCAVHAGSVAGAFLNWDDDRFVTANPLWHGPVGDYVVAALTRVQFDAYHPLHLLAYLPDRLLWPSSPAGFHVLNVLVFAADVALLYLLARRAGAAVSGAALAALLFAVHPLVVEPVAWISARKDPLALLFFLAALLVEDRRAATATRPSWKAIALFACALLTKTSAVVFPIVLGAWLLWMRRASLRTVLLRVAPYAALAVATSIAVVTIWTDHRMIPSTRPFHPVVDVLATLGTYVRRMLVPIDLSPIYPAAGAVEAAVAAGVALGAFVLLRRRLPPAARYAVVALLGALLPVANLVPVVFRFADRYALIALAVVIPALALLLRRRVARVVAGVAIVLLAVMTLRQHQVWRSSTALWAHATATHPDAYMARLKHGETLRDARRWPEAVAQVQAAIRLDEGNLLGWVGLFYLYALRAETEGRLPAGTAETWLRAFGPAVGDEAAFRRLVASVPRDACPPCVSTLLVVGLTRWPLPDEQLVAAARAALDRGARDLALIYLSRVRERTAAVRELEEAAR